MRRLSLKTANNEIEGKPSDLNRGNAEQREQLSRKCWEAVPKRRIQRFSLGILRPSIIIVELKTYGLGVIERIEASF